MKRNDIDAPFQHRITIWIDGDGWMSRDNSPETLELFGTDVLPTPFLRNTRASAVVSVLQELNPDAEIVVKGGAA